MIAEPRESGYNATATKILQTATRLFMQRGYSAVSVNDIVQAAEVTKPTLYYHFSDKEELFVLVAIHMLADMYRALEAARAGREGIAEQLTAVAEVLLHSPNGDTRMMRHQAREHLSAGRQQRLSDAFGRYMFAPLCAMMQQALDRGEVGGHSAPDLAMLFLGFMEGFQRQSPADAGSHPSHMFSTDRFSTETLIGLFLHGISPRV